MSVCVFWEFGGGVVVWLEGVKGDAYTSVSLVHVRADAFFL